MVSTIILYKFTEFTRAEVDKMLGIELQQTRVYRDAKAEGKAEGIVEGKAEGILDGEKALVLRQLQSRLGNLSSSVRSQLESLGLEQVGQLGEDLLEFNAIEDLTIWLQNNISS
jgi:predicted transposase YdaD